VIAVRAKQGADGRPTRPFGATRAELALIAVLIAAAGVGWWRTVDTMRGMDNGPWSSLGALGWFLGVWVVMMAAMMLPSATPTVTLYSRMMRARSAVAPFVFVTGYLATWAAVGLLSFAIALVGRRAGGDFLAWHRAGRWAAGATLLAAAVYEVTPMKEACLGKCRSPLAFLLGSWRDGWSGALQMGIKHGAWCVGCCWVLMASLFALGIMSVAWMALVGGLIALEKTLPWRRVAIYGVAAVLLVLGLLLIVDPGAIPALTIPSHHAMSSSSAMGS
jgi:predicted metal-binding membrane protein